MGLRGILISKKGYLFKISEEISVGISVEISVRIFFESILQFFDKKKCFKKMTKIPDVCSNLYVQKKWALWQIADNQLEILIDPLL